MQIRVNKTFSYMAGEEKVRVPRGLSVDLPDDAAKAAIAAGDAVAAGDFRPKSAVQPQPAEGEHLNLDEMSHADLLALAEQRGVDAKKSNSKAEIAAAIKAHV